MVNFSFWDHKITYFIFYDIHSQIKLIFYWVNMELSYYDSWEVVSPDPM